MKMHPVIFLFRDPGKIGLPKPPEHEQEEDQEKDIPLLIQGFFQLHVTKYRGFKTPGTALSDEAITPGQLRVGTALVLNMYLVSDTVEAIA